jgi:predicted amidohydrolase YtcJ
MNLQIRFTIVFVFVIVSAPIRATELPADIVVLNAKVLTVDAKFTTADAVAIRDGVFVRVGTNDQVKAHVGEKTKVLDAHGKTVIPGLIESHVHAIGVARGEVAQPFIQLGSIAEMQQWVRDRVKKTPEGSWIQLPRVDITRVKERRMPTRAELDAAAPKHPVVFNWQYAARQVQILNTVAIKTAGITRDTPDPAGGKIVKGADGEPTGVLENPRGLLSKFLVAPKISEKDTLDSLEKTLRAYNAVGITSIGVGRMSKDCAFEKLNKEGRLTVRVNARSGYRLMARSRNERSRQCVQFGDGDDWVRVGPLKIAVDGGILYGTALMRDPYGKQAFSLYGLSDPQYKGQLSLKPEHVKAMIRAGHKLGWQMCSHVTGDAGVDLVLDAVEEAGRDKSIKESRYTLIHAYFPNEAAAMRAAALGVCVDTQTAWYYKDGDALADALGGTRMKNFIGLSVWKQAGVTVALNSDHMQDRSGRSLNYAVPDHVCRHYS